MKKYVVLEHLSGHHKGHRFWTTNTKDNTKLYDETIAYKEIAFTDSSDEAIKMCRL
jgi:hypothetical protein